MLDVERIQDAGWTKKRRSLSSSPGGADSRTRSRAARMARTEIVVENGRCEGETRWNLGQRDRREAEEEKEEEYRQRIVANYAFLLTSRSSGEVLFAAINFAPARSVGKTNSCKIHPELPPAVRTPRKEKGWRASFMKFTLHRAATKEHREYMIFLMGSPRASVRSLEFQVTRRDLY